MTLDDAVSTAHDDVVVTAVDLPTAQRRRLAELGLRPGSPVRVVKRAAGGGLVLALGTSRVAIDRSTSTHITVDPVS